MVKTSYSQLLVDDMSQDHRHCLVQTIDALRSLILSPSGELDRPILDMCLTLGNLALRGSVLQLRMWGISIIASVVTIYTSLERQEEAYSRDVAKWIKETALLAYLFGPHAHVELLTRASDLFETIQAADDTLFVELLDQLFVPVQVLQ